MSGLLITIIVIFFAVDITDIPARRVVLTLTPGSQLPARVHQNRGPIGAPRRLGAGHI